MKTSGMVRGAKIEIDQLVVSGVSSSDAERVVAAIVRELSSLAATSGSRPHGSLMLESETYEIAAGLGTEEMGRKIARSIWNSRGGGGFASARGLALAEPESRSSARAMGNDREILDE